MQGYKSRSDKMYRVSIYGPSGKVPTTYWRSYQRLTPEGAAKEARSVYYRKGKVVVTPVDYHTGNKIGESVTFEEIE